HLFDGWDRRFRELDVTTRTPGNDTRFTFGQLVQRTRGHPAGNIGVARPQLNDATAMSGTAHDTVSHAEFIHDVERRQCHVRRFEHIAAGVEYKVRPLTRFRRRAVFEALVHILTKTRKVAL